jgi:peptide/nickel transport system substrate-binding protein
MPGWKLFMAGAYLLAGFSLVFAQVGEAAAAQVLRIGLADDPDMLDPSMSRTFTGRIVFAALCDKLIDIDPDLGLVPQLATEWRWTDGNKGLVMSLRRGVKFHDGEPLDAAAVKYSLERHLTLPGSTRKAEISAVKQVETIDDHTVKLVLSAPSASLLSQLADRAGMIVAPGAAKAEGENFAAHPVCAGPFKFVERIAEDRIVLARFADYWNKDAINFDRIVYLPIPDSTVRLANLQSGGLDIIERVAATDAQRLRKDPSVSLAAITGLGYSAIIVNLANGERSKNPLGQDKRVRQALQLSIDRTALNQVVFNGEFQPGNQWMPPGNPYYVKELPIPPRDLAKAKALLAEAGQPNPSIEMLITNTPELLQAGQVIQSMAQEAGFQITLKAVESALLIQLGTKGQYQARLGGWSGRIDPDGNLYNFIKCKAPLNDNGYCNQAVDGALDAARTAANPAERLADYRQVAEHTLQDLPLIYLWHNKWLWAATPRLKGFIPYPDGLIRPQGLHFDQASAE